MAHFLSPEAEKLIPHAGDCDLSLKRVIIFWQFSYRRALGRIGHFNRH